MNLKNNKQHKIMSTVYVTFRDIMISRSKRAKNCWLYLNDCHNLALLHCNTVNGLFRRTTRPHLCESLFDYFFLTNPKKNLFSESGHVCFWLYSDDDTLNSSIAALCIYVFSFHKRTR